MAPINRTRDGHQNTRPKQKAGGARQQRKVQQDPIAGLTVVRRTWFLDGLMLETHPGYFRWTPNQPHDAVGTVAEFMPLVARAKVRIGFRSKEDIYYQAGNTGKEKMAKTWSSGWIDLHEFQAPSMRSYGNAPKGEYYVESAGVVPWEQEGRAALKGYREPVESDDEDDVPVRQKPAVGLNGSRSSPPSSVAGPKRVS